MKKVTAIFDIGKTNKKFILFDRHLKEVHKEYIHFAEIEDEDGDPCDDLKKIKTWMISCITKLNDAGKFRIEKINFSTYGASLVHIDKNGNVLTHLYNYTKKIEKQYIDNLYSEYGGVAKISKQTASPPSGMLNSGIQLYWLKYHRPEIYSKIEYSLHLPQYLSYFITGQPISEYTSIGCHTMLWNYKTKSYHRWVKSEKIDKKLAPIVRTDAHYTIDYNGNSITIGTGVHDSSAALLPYLLAETEPFILISTGTWCVTLNPYYTDSKIETSQDLEVLKYMTKSGKPVKAARVFLGHEYQLQIEKLTSHFDVDKERHKKIKFNKDIYLEILKTDKKCFQFNSLELSNQLEIDEDLSSFKSFDYGYHQLMHELILIQVENTKLAIGDIQIDKIYVDGGFIDNDIYIKLLTYYFPDKTILTAQSPIGSAIGAALLMNKVDDAYDVLKQQFNIKEYSTLILKNTKSKII